MIGPLGEKVATALDGQPFERTAIATAACTMQHSGALAWREAVPIPLGLVWLPDGWAMLPEQSDLWNLLIPQGALQRIRRAFKCAERGRRLRATHALTERLALPVAVGEALGRSSRSAIENRKSKIESPLHLSHTPLGQPLVRWRGAVAEWARENGIRARDIHISFSHDGDAHLALAARAPGLIGIGIDVVYLPRLTLPGKDAEYLHRFARHFMSDDEFARFGVAAESESLGDLRIRAASHFSLMEAASKALGTGLKIGGGMGKPESLPKQSIGVAELEPEVVFLLGDAAWERCRALGARRLTGYWGADREYLVSACLLWQS